MKVVPDPTTWATIPSWAWHRAGIDPSRARTVTACARRAARLEEITRLTPEEADARLRVIPGVGAWTAAEVAQRAFGNADALSVGDRHLAGVVGHFLFGREFDDGAMVAALAPWRPHRYRVVRLLETAGHYRVRRRGPAARSSTTATDKPVGDGTGVPSVVRNDQNPTEAGNGRSGRGFR